MHKKYAVALGIALFTTGMAVVRQISVPDIESAQKKVYQGFDELERLGAYVVAEDGTSLGKISKGMGKDSLGNDYGAGSTYKTDGLFNQYSKYGDKYSQTSAFNSMASKPPQILIARNGDTYSVGLLTCNSMARTRGQRIDPVMLKAWLASR